MKKLLTVLLGVLMVLSLAGCGSKEETPAPEVDPAPTAANNYADFVAASNDTELELLMSVQAHQGWWENEGKGVVTVYAQDDDGGYLCYNMEADEATANAMTPGTLIRVKGYKSEWSGEVELVDATCEIVAGGYDGKVYDAKDVTSLSGDQEALKEYMNQKCLFKELQVSADGWTYGWDGSGTRGDDIYLNLVCPNDARMTFVVESYLTGADSDVYKLVESLQTGDLVDITCFMYWYEAPQPHIFEIAKVS